MTEPIFIETDGAQIVADLVAAYQAITGKVLQPAQPERLLINTFAYRELLLREQVQLAALQNLVSFASAPALDYLGELVGVTRLAAASAACTLQFSLIAGHTGVVIPEGTRIASGDGKVLFVVAENKAVASGVLTSSIPAYCQQVGVLGNGYPAGEISELLDPLPFVTSVSNTDETSGGADAESDDALRARIKLAPEAFSTAGSEGAYKFHAKSASAAVLDVAVIGPPTTDPGTVNVYPLTDTIPTPAPVIALVEAACNAEKVRPLTDTVVVLSPTGVTYSIDVELTCYTDANTVDIVTTVTTALTDFAAQRRTQIGLDVMLSQITGLCMVPGVYDVNIVAPSADVTIDPTEVAVLSGSVNVEVTGLTNG